MCKVRAEYEACGGGNVVQMLETHCGVVDSWPSKPC